jgi:hypothetical protein
MDLSACSLLNTQLTEHPRTSIENLPDDVLSLVFLLYIDPYSLHVDELSTTTTELRLVSHLWNVIVIYSPRIWSNIHIIFCESTSPVPPPSTLQRWIGLSSEVPLTVVLESGREEKDDPVQFCEYLDILAGAIHRWRNVRIHFSAESSKQLSNAFQRYDFSKAELMDFINFTLRSPDGDSLATIVKSLALSPALRHIRWAPCDFPCSYAMIRHFPLERLNSLYLGFYMLLGAVDVLRKATSAEHITLYFAQPGVTHFLLPHTEPIYLPKLRVIEIVVQELKSPFLTLLNAPHLSILCINYVDFANMGAPPPSSVLPAQLKEVLTRCRSVQVLIINSLPYSEISSLIGMPELQSLRVVEIIYSDVSQYDELERTLVEESEKEKKKNDTPSQSRAKTVSSTTGAKVTTTRERKRVMQVKPLLDGALLLGWTDPDLQEEFSYIPQSPAVRMCGRTMEWWRVIRKFEAQK